MRLVEAKQCGRDSNGPEGGNPNMQHREALRKHPLFLFIKKIIFVNTSDWSEVFTVS